MENKLNRKKNGNKYILQKDIYQLNSSLILIFKKLKMYVYYFKIYV